MENKSSVNGHGAAAGAATAANGVINNNNNNNSGVNKRPGSKRTASSSPRGSAFSPRNQAHSRKSSRNYTESGDDYPTSSSPLRSPLSPSKQNGNRRSSRDPANAWSSPLNLGAGSSPSEGRRAPSRRCLEMAAAGAANSRGSGGGADAAADRRRSSLSRGGGDGDGATAMPPSYSSTLSSSSKRAGSPAKRPGSPDSGFHHSPAPSSSLPGSNRSSEERHGSRSRSRTHSGSSSSCLETISTMNESKDWGSVVEDRELLEFELAEHVDRVHEKLSRGVDGAAVPSKEELMNTMETDLDVIARRKKQISYGKNTQAYGRYIQTIPKYNRTKGVHPMTPDKYKKLSRRSFDSLVKRWKQDIATWDPTQSSTSLAGSSTPSSADASPLGPGRSSVSSSRSASASGSASSSASASVTTSGSASGSAVGGVMLRHSRDTGAKNASKKRPPSPICDVDAASAGFDTAAATSASAAVYEEETSQDSCASAAELMSSAMSLASPVKRPFVAVSGAASAASVSASVAKDPVDAGWTGDDLRQRLRARLEAD